MQSERWIKVEDIFQTALGMAPDSRGSYLQEACGADSELLTEVQSLLVHHQQPSGDSKIQAFRDLGSLLRSGVRVLWPGDRLGRFEIVRQLGNGGMGAVYLARDSVLGRLVALKTMNPDSHPSTEDARRFEREAQTVSALNHPNIVTIYDFGREGDLDFIASEYVEGRTLRERLAAGPVALDEALDICIQATAGIASAHAAGIVHRDLKPENIMLRPDSVVKVVDFGLASMTAPEVDPAALRTNAGTVMGTVPYMSPEQTRGLAAGPASDVWSLGVMLFELTAGRHPFAAPTAAETKALIASGSVRLDQVPGSIRRIVRGALHNDTGKRYSSADDLTRALQDARRGLRRTRIARSRIVPATVAFLGVAGVVWWTLGPRIPSSAVHTQLVRVTDAGNVTDSALSPDGRLLAYATDDGSAQTLKVRQLATRSDVVLRGPDRTSYRGLVFSPDGEHLYYRALETPHVGTLFRIPAMGGGLPHKLVDDVDSPPALSPDGSRLAYMRLQPENKRSVLLVANPDGSNPREIASRPFPENFFDGGIAWSPDGAEIAVTARTRRSGRARDTIVRTRVADGRPVAGDRVEVASAGRIAWLRDGIYFLAAVERSQPLQLYRLRRGADPEPVTSDANDYRTLSNLPSSRRLALVDRQRTSGVFVGSIGTPDDLRSITPATGRYAYVSWAKPGTLLTQTVVAGVAQLWVVAQDGTWQRSLTEQRSMETNVRACAGGEYIVFAANRTGNLRIWRTDADGRDPVQLSDGPGDDVAPSCSPDGKWMMFSSSRKGDTTLWKVSMAGGASEQVGPEITAYPEISLDGRLVACTLLDAQAARLGAVAVLDIASGKVVARFRSVPDSVALRWTPDGSLSWVRTAKGVSNIFAQDLNGGPERQLTHFDSMQIFAFDWRKDDATLALVRGLAVQDAVLLTLP